MEVRADPILIRFRQALAHTYGEQLKRVVLFGSRARGEAHAHSDYDVAIFLHRLGSFGDETSRLAEIETDILLDTGAIINALPFAADSEAHRTGFMSELRRDGIDL